MGLLVKTLQDDGNRFVPGLIVLSWEDESMDDLAERVCPFLAVISSRIADMTSLSYQK